MSGFWELTVRGDFSAAHFLRHYRGKCENRHGHNFGVEVTIRGHELDAATGMLLDFGIIKKCLNQVLAELDHKDINAVAPFDVINPSSENLARHIWRQMREALAACDDPQAQKVEVTKVSVGEKAAQSAAWIALTEP